MIVRAAPPEHWTWITERARVVPGRDFGAIEVVEGDRILGMVAFDGWTPGSVCLHVAVDEPIALRRLIKAGFEVAFLPSPRGFDRRVAIAGVLSTNEKSLRLVKGLGFREMARGRDWWAPGVDMVLHEMRRETWKETRWAA